MTTVLFFLSRFITKVPLDATVLSTFPARNNCSPHFQENIGMCFSTTHFSLCIIQEGYQGKICHKGCLLPESLFPPYFISWSSHDKLPNLHLYRDWECCFPAWSITTATQQGFGYFPPTELSCRSTAGLQALAIVTKRDKLQDPAATRALNKTTLHLPDLTVRSSTGPCQGPAGLREPRGRQCREQHIPSAQPWLPAATGVGAS